MKSLRTQKRVIMLMFLLAVFNRMASAQVALKGPALNPDLMTYFQDEMSSLMKFNFDRVGDNVKDSYFWPSGEAFKYPLFLSGRAQLTSINEEIMSRPGYEGYMSNHGIKPLTTTINNIVNGLAGIQIRINDNLFIPIFASTSMYTVTGTVDEGTLTVNNRRINNGNIIIERNDYYYGGGLFLRNDYVSFGAFAGLYESSYTEKLDSYVFSYYDEEDPEISSTNRTFKIAITPGIHMSEIKYIGKVFNDILGYVGMGNRVQVFAGEEDPGIFDDIAGLLNYGLNVYFNVFNLGSFNFKPMFYYSRKNYDAVSKNEDYALSVTTTVGGFGITAASGYRNFYSVSKYFESRYTPTWFCDAGISFIFDDSHSVNFYYSYDDVRTHKLGIVYDANEDFSALFFAGQNKVTKITQELERTSTVSYLDAGLRFRGGLWPLFVALGIAAVAGVVSVTSTF